MFTVLARRSYNDSNKWVQLIDDRLISINADRQLDWPNCGHSTRVIDVTYEDNTVYVHTASGAEYAIRFVLQTHGKAEWREAKENAWRLACKLNKQLPLPRCYQSAYGQDW